MPDTVQNALHILSFNPATIPGGSIIILILQLRKWKLMRGRNRIQTCLRRFEELGWSDFGRSNENSFMEATSTPKCRLSGKQVLDQDNENLHLNLGD